MKDEATTQADIEERKLRFEERKFEEELRQRRILNDIEERRLRKTDPLVLAVVGGLIAAFSGVGVSLLNGWNERSLLGRKHDMEMADEVRRAEGSLILEAIKLGDPDRTACTLKFMMSAGLIQTERVHRFVDAYLLARNGGSGVGVDVGAGELPSAGQQPTLGVLTPGCQAAPTVKDFNPGTDSTTKPAPSHGPEQVLQYTTDWMGGGHNQNEACEEAINKFKPSYPGKVLKRISSDEASKKSTFGHVEYKYFCTVGIFGADTGP